MDPATEAADATLTVRTGEPPAPAAALSPTEHVTASALKTVVVKDALGRSLTVRKVGSLQKLDLAAALGRDHVSNPVVYGTGLVAISVVAIDGDTVFPPQKYSEVRALVSLLEDEGIEAIQNAMIEHFGFEAITQESVQDAVKNS